MPFQIVRQDITKMDIDDIHIDLSQVPKYQMDSLCKVIIEGCKKFYSDPKNVEAYEKWKAEREFEKNKLSTTIEQQP